ncbi:hypothetical protein NHX12_031677 [Muraenolepis orangiensis]|uniref:Endonuclease/exonuclease/phosphatase domain-containing protein n=1 Tax=Muraenolepis orangiensis TaxID=630683 RepID=A0A9Q0IJ51_9TELE|nr:hypothetical protein NHX12_031677 [Muraenolepis orangiensis]
MGDTADQLLIKLLSWLEQKELCAQHLRKLVRELEALRKRCNGGECVGSTVTVIGAACIIGTFFTAGAATPFLVALGAAYMGTGTAVSLTSKVIEHFVSGSTVADAQKVAKQSETNEVEIMKLIKKLKMERANTDQDEDKYIAQRFTLAMWGKAHTGKPPIVLQHIGKDGKITGSLVKWGVQQLARTLAKAGGKTAVKSATKLLGAVGMVFALNESIDNWKEMVKEKHVTEASQSLRDSAEKIEQFCKELRNELKIIEQAIEQANQQTNHNQANSCDQNQQTNHNQANSGDQNQQTNHNQTNSSDQNQQTNGNQANNSGQNQQTNSDKEDEDKEWNNGGNGNQQVTDSDQDSDEDSESDEEEMQGFSRMGLLNVRSMAKAKAAQVILDIIVQNDLDVLLTTETWLKPSNFESILQDACPPNFTFYHQSRDGQRGGGVGIQHTTSYRGEQIWFSNITTFEYVAVVLQNDEWEVPVLLVNVYFPSGYSRGEFYYFLFDFEMLLRDINRVFDHVIFTGDFNIHVDQGMQSKTIEFYFLLKQYGLEQHVNKKTHNKGHTLDLVFTRNVDVSDLIVFDPHISDHYIVIFMSIPVAPNKKRKSLKKKKDKKN